LYFMFPSLVLGRGIFFISLTLVPAFIGLNRITLNRIWQAAQERGLILGTSRLPGVVASEFGQRNDFHVEVVGFVEPNGVTAGRDELRHGPVLGKGENLKAIAEQNGISRVIVALEDRRDSLPIRDLLRLKVHGIRIEDAQTTIAALTGRVWL